MAWELNAEHLISTECWIRPVAISFFASFAIFVFYIYFEQKTAKFAKKENVFTRLAPS
jgi:hypothetical protein